MALTTLREMVGTRRAKFGTFLVEFASPGIGQILKAGGCQYALLDMEHSGFGFATVKRLLRYMQAAAMPTIVRVPSRHYHHIARALDMGAEGIMLPMVGTAEEARRIVAHAKYPPLGHRGVALGIAHDRYAPVRAPAAALRAANRRTAVFAQVETRRGIENVEEIAAVAGIDCLWIGHFDLTVSLGIPGDVGHADFTAAIERAARACVRHKKAYGRVVPDVATGVAAYHAGFDFIGYSSDAWLLRDTLRRGIDDLKGALRRRRAG